MALFLVLAAVVLGRRWGDASSRSLGRESLCVVSVGVREGREREKKVRARQTKSTQRYFVS